MKKIIYAFIFSFFINISVVYAEVKDLAPILKEASATESLSKVLEEITLLPAKDPKTGKAVFKVTKVKKGSIYQRKGIKIGDLVTQ